MTTCIANGFSNGIVLPAKQKEFIGGMYACDGSDIPVTQDLGTTTQGPSETAYSVPANTVAYTVIGKTQCGKDVRRIITTTYTGRAEANSWKITMIGYFNQPGVTPILNVNGTFVFYGATSILARSAAKTYALTVWPVTSYYPPHPDPFTLDTVNSNYTVGAYSYGGVPNQALLYYGSIGSEIQLTLYYLDTHVVYTYVTP